MNLPDLLRSALRALFSAKTPTGRHYQDSPDRTARVDSPAAEPTAEAVEAQRRREEDTTYLTVAQIRAVMNPHVADRFPTNPATPNGPRGRGVAEVRAPRQVADNTSARWQQ